VTYAFRLPDIGEGVVEGEVVRWLVKEGDLLREDQPMVEIMTDKATVEIPAPRAGRVARRLFAEGQSCPVGKVLIEIDTGASEAAVPSAQVAAPAVPALGVGGLQSGSPRSGTSSEAPASDASPSDASRAPASPRSAGSANGSATPTSVLATPATRKLARDAGIDIREIAGSGPAGRVMSDDVVAMGTLGGSPTPPAKGPAGQSPSGSHAIDGPSGGGADVRIPFRGLRKRIAETLVRSKHSAPHATYVEEIDCTDLVALRARYNAELAARALQAGAGEVGKLSFLPFIIRATVAALKKFPQMNATLDEAAGEIIQRRSYHIGLATATEAGLIVPVVRDADGKSLLELARDIDRLAGLTRTGKAAREELVGSTFTITSLGALGGIMATAIINPPEVAILGVHRVVRRPAVVEDRIEIRDLMNLSVSFDHRVVDGYDAARFVAEIKASLEAPDALGLPLG
jgi:pyruvate dehydrogenase E2 component (dihydrolipoyllysine-residue acetyltransferase)